MARLVQCAVNCVLESIEASGPTVVTQHREYWGGPTNGRAAACRAVA